MSITATEQLPGGTTLDELQTVLRESLGRPDLVLDETSCSSVVHTITAPATESLTRIRVVAHDSESLEISLVAKCLQTALRGLPPQIPKEEREQLAASIPWRLEAEVYTGDTASRMPPGVRLPRLHAALERPDERIVLWLEDVDPMDTPWSPANLERAATALGRLTVRRADQVLASLPPGSFLEQLVQRGLKSWALPHIRSDVLWAHPAFAQTEVAALRPELLRLAAEVDALFAGLAEVPWHNAHGDPTPMNMLRPRTDPESFVLIDWGLASPGPVGGTSSPWCSDRPRTGPRRRRTSSTGSRWPCRRSRRAWPRRGGSSPRALSAGRCVARRYSGTRSRRCPWASSSPGC